MALLAYLAVHNSFCSRDELSEMLYPQLDRKRAKADFRQILSELRKVIGDDNIISNRFSVSLNLSGDISVDIQRFRESISQKSDADNLYYLKEAVSLYRGPFLSGFYLDANYSFEQWQLSMEDQILWEYTSTLELLIDRLKEKEDYSDAISYCRILNNLDPLDERIHRKMMELYSLNSQNLKIAEQYEKCRRVIFEEIGEEPEEETCTLFHMLNGKKIRHVTANNIPTWKVGLIGRKRELEAIIKLVLKEKESLLTLVGPGGTGKTLISLYAADKFLDHFSQGVYFIDLTGIFSVDEAVSAISGCLEIIDNRSVGESAFSLLHKFLVKRDICLVLDNFEQLQGGAQFVENLLSKAQYLKILITSRVPLKIDCEKVFQVPPLSIPPVCCGVGCLLDIKKYDAIELFRERAEEIDPGFKITTDNCDSVWEICRSLDGLPLAIELAVSRLNVLSCDEIRNRLTSKMKLLVNKDKTMKSTIEWSYNLLNSEEKSLFMKLSVFQGSCSIEAIENLSGGEILDCVSSLISKNMLNKKEEKGETRYFMYETLKEYAGLKLKENGSINAVRQIHGEYYFSLAEKAESCLKGPDQVEWVEKLTEDEKNFLGALDWFRNNGKGRESVRLIIYLNKYWYYRSYYRQMRKFLCEILDKYRKNLTEELNGQAYCLLGWMTFITGDWQNATVYYRKALIYSVQTDDRETQCLILSRISVVERWIGETQIGLEHGLEAIELADQIGDPYYSALSLIYFYCTCGGIFPGEDPLDNLKKALKLSRETGDTWSISHSLSGLGDYYRERQEYFRAQQYYNKALVLYKKSRDQWAEAWVLGDLGLTLCRKGETAKGVDHLKKSILQMDRIGDRGGMMLILNRLTVSLIQSGFEQQAVPYLAVSQKIYNVIVNSSMNIYPVEENLQQMINTYKPKFKSEWLKGELMEHSELIQSISSDLLNQ